MVPAVGVSRPQSMRIAVVLPDPLGPRKPKISPCGMARSTLSTATSLPKCLLRPLLVMAGSVTGEHYLRGYAGGQGVSFLEIELRKVDQAGPVTGIEGEIGGEGGIGVEGWSVWDALPGFAKCKDLSDFFDQYDASPNISFLGPGACGHDDWMVRDVTPPLFSKDLPADQFFVVSIGNATLWGRKRHVRIFDANKKLLHSSYEGGWLAKVWGTHTTKQD